MDSKRWQGAGVAAVAVLALVGVVPSGAGAAQDVGAPQDATSQPHHGGRQLAGTWRVTVQPDGAPTAAAFDSTLVYTSTGSVVETTSRAPSSAGLGVWDRLGAGRFEVVVEKYRFEGAVFAGRTVVSERSQLTPDGSRYTGRAVTTVLDASGRVLRTFASTATGVRL
jgi:hypothetical protein